MPDWRAEIRARIPDLGIDPVREAAIVEELALDLADRFDELCSRGVTPGEAFERIRAEHLSDDGLGRALQQVELPSPPTEPVWGGSGERRWGGLVTDIRYAARSLRKSPGLTAIVLLTLAIGIGANTAIFSVVNAVLLRPPPFEDPARLVTFWGTAPEKGLTVVNYPDGLFDYHRRRLTTARPIALHTQVGFTLTGAGSAERLEGANVTGEFFGILGVRPHLGRFFVPDEEAPGKNLVTVLSYGLWQTRFGGDPSIVGQAIMLNGLATTVVGVMPSGFTYPGRTRVWVPIPLDPSSLDCWCYNAIGRLAAGKTPDDMALEVDRVNADFWAEREGRARPVIEAGQRRGTVVRLLARELVSDVRTPVLVLLGAVILVLLIGCANLASLLLARSAARSREVAVRAALGASPRRIARQLLAESLLLSLSGAALGVLLAGAAISGLSRVAIERVSHLEPIGLDPGILGFAAGLGLFTGILFGFAPAFRGSRVDLTAAIKEGSRGSAEAPTRRLNDAFVVVQLAGSLMLLVGAGLLLRSFANLLSIDPGFRPENTLVARLSIPWTTYTNMSQVRGLADRLIQEVTPIPGVSAAALSSTAPFSQNENQQELIVQGQEPGPDTPVPVASVRRVSPGYFEAVGTRLIEGRDFTPADRNSDELVAVVDESVARRYWPGRSALGNRISTSSRQPVWRTVVGVVASIRHQDLARAPDHYIYLPLGQSQAWNLDLVVRGPAVSGLRGVLQDKLSAIDPTIPMYEVHTLEEAIGRSLSTRRFTQQLLFGFALAAMLLAAIGIYGVMARNVSARIREFGIRLSLGATPAHIEALVLRRAFRLVLLGAGLGVAGALGTTRLLQALLYQVSPIDLPTFTLAVVILAGTAMAASWMPARRATGADPLEALRSD